MSINGNGKEDLSYILSRMKNNKNQDALSKTRLANTKAVVFTDLS